MTYASEDQLREYLDMDADTDTSIFGSVLLRAHSMINDELGFTFGGEAIQRTLDVTADQSVLWIPSPGAESITSIVEDGTTLETDGTDYELDPDDGAFILRLDDGIDTSWVEGKRTVVVTYAPREAPQSLVQAELVEAARIWRAKSAGFSDVIGVQGVNELKYSKAFAASTWRTIETLRGRYGRSVPSGGAGGEGWIIR